jgi:ascorbate-specific PTS system EIIC-type component UlaA
MIAYFPVSKSAIIFGFVSKVVTALGLLALLIDGTDTGTDFVVDT